MKVLRKKILKSAPKEKEAKKGDRQGQGIEAARIDESQGLVDSVPMLHLRIGSFDHGLKDGVREAPVKRK